MNSSEKRLVLCIEDNPINIFLVQAIFASRPNTELLTATHGQLGLELAKQRPPDLILLDLNLPDMRGEEFLQQLRGTEATARVPVVIVSGEVLGEERIPLQQMGVMDFLTKPFDLEQFEQIVDRHLRHAKKP